VGSSSAKAPVFGSWKSLDFLGFSRLNRAFSMGYAGFSLKEISRALLPKRRRQNGVHGGPRHADAKTYSPGKSSAISVFRQSIVARQKMATRQFSHTIHTIVGDDFLQYRTAMIMMHSDALVAPICRLKKRELLLCKSRQMFNQTTDITRS
jgi:hypothetical protein